jgi:hypothetical protein
MRSVCGGYSIFDFQSQDRGCSPKGRWFQIVFEVCSQSAMIEAIGGGTEICLRDGPRFMGSDFSRRTALFRPPRLASQVAMKSYGNCR